VKEVEAVNSPERESRTGKHSASAMHAAKTRTPGSVSGATSPPASAAASRTISPPRETAATYRRRARPWSMRGT
jgi:hypothetical protein